MSIIKMHLILAINPLTQAVAKIGKIWADGLSNNAEKMDDRIKTSIPDEMTYLSKLADTSELEFRRVIDPSFTNRKGEDKNKINATQAYKIRKSYPKYQRNRTHMFETVDGVTAKRFKDRVQASQDTYAERVSETTLAFTGIKSLESGPARIVIFWLTGDPKARGLIRPADRIMAPSEPFSVTTPEKRNLLRQALSTRLIQSGMRIVHSALSGSIITEMNNVGNSVVQGYLDPSLGLESFTPGGASHLDFIKENGQLFLSVKVSQV
ncbi:MAG: hypothetical protein HY811_10160 [Planctomycetes bacterium]|nr:hypothetical protein [Planctomycetota bacterium]